MGHLKTYRRCLFAALGCILLIHGDPALAVEQKKAAGAWLAYREGRFREALRYYVSGASAGDPRGAVNAAIIFKELGSYRDAVHFLERACPGAGCDPRLLTLLARVYLLNNQRDKAMKAALGVIKKDPADVDALLLAGSLTQEEGDDTAAQEYYRKVLELDKANLSARISLADIYARRRNYEDAVAEYKRANLIDASVMSAQRALGELLFRMGNLEESLRLYRRLGHIDPKDEIAKKRIKEISDRLGKEYFESERRRIAQKRKEKAVFVKPVISAKGVPLVRIGVAAGEKSIEFMASTPFEIFSVSKKPVLTNGRKKQVYSITKASNDVLAIAGPDCANSIVGGCVVIKPLEPEGTLTMLNTIHGKANFWSNRADRSYRGMIEIRPATEGLVAINILSLEEYLYSVVPSEMPSRWPLEALKAQAVAARSEAMKKMGRHEADGFDLCAEVHCQAYAGVERETEKSIKAVDETRGLIMLYNGKPVDAVYSSNCGGHTQGNVFSDQRPVPYWQPKFDSLSQNPCDAFSDPFDLEMWLRYPPADMLCDTAPYGQTSSFRWVRVYTSGEMDEIVRKHKDIGRVRSIVVSKRNVSGHIAAVRIQGTRSSLVLERELNIRKALGDLRSSMFKVEVRYDERRRPRQFIFYGGGWGHGVGMCQSGAFGMAQRAKEHKEILKHYFQGVDFKKAY